MDNESRERVHIARGQLKMGIRGKSPATQAHINTIEIAPATPDSRGKFGRGVMSVDNSREPVHCLCLYVHFRNIVRSFLQDACL